MIQNRSEIKYWQSSRYFKFGDGKSSSLKKVRLPAFIAGMTGQIDTEVVPCDIPLLLSRNSMQKSNTKLDFAKNSVNMFGKDIELSFTSSGHYCILLPHPQPNIFFSLLESATPEEKMKIATKLHKQFSHAPYDKLQELLREGGTTDKELLKMIEAVKISCETCQRYKKPPLRPIVSLCRSK